MIIYTYAQVDFFFWKKLMIQRMCGLSKKILYPGPKVLFKERALDLLDEKKKKNAHLHK